MPGIHKKMFVFEVKFKFSQWDGNYLCIAIDSQMSVVRGKVNESGLLGLCFKVDNVDLLCGISKLFHL